MSSLLTSVFPVSEVSRPLRRPWRGSGRPGLAEPQQLLPAAWVQLRSLGLIFRARENLHVGPSNSTCR